MYVGCGLVSVSLTLPAPSSEEVTVHEDSPRDTNGVYFREIPLRTKYCSLCFHRGTIPA